jgi:hypothetical protein
MADVTSITIIPDIVQSGRKEGEVTGHTIRAHVEVGGEEQEREFTPQDPQITSLIDQLVSKVRKEVLEEGRAEMEGVVDAESAFEKR